MTKAINALANAAFALGFALLAAAAWGLSEVYMDVPAPITPFFWLCSVVLGFGALVYAIEAILTPFRKA